MGNSKYTNIPSHAGVPSRDLFNMNLIRSALAILAGAVLSGCSTAPVPAPKVFPVAVERQLAFQEQSAKATATVAVTRDGGAAASGCYLALYIDQVLAARLGTGETGQFFMEPGEHLLQGSQDPSGKGSCRISGTSYGSPRIVILHENEKKTFRLSIDQTGFIDIQRFEYPDNERQRR